MSSKYDANPSRWTCVYPTAFCEGKFKVYGEKRPCPLYEKCRAGEAAGKNQYEFPMERVPMKHQYYEQTDPEWNKKHTARRNELVKAFTPEAWAGYMRTANRKRKDEIARFQREQKEERKWARLEELIEERGEMWFGPGARHILLKCGEDCKACPYGGRCRYTDADEDELFMREYPDWKPPDFKKRAQNRLYKRRRKERLRAAGLCTTCGKRPAVRGGSTCWQCREDNRLKRTKRGW